MDRSKRKKGTKKDWWCNWWWIFARRNSRFYPQFLCRGSTSGHTNQLGPFQQHVPNGGEINHGFHEQKHHSSLTYWMWASPSPKMANEHVVWWIVIVLLYPDVMVNYMGVTGHSGEISQHPLNILRNFKPSKNDAKNRRSLDYWDVCTPILSMW